MFPYTVLSEKDILILKGNHNKILGMGKDPVVAVMFAYNDEKLLEPVEVPSLISFSPNAFRAESIPNSDTIFDIL